MKRIDIEKVKEFGVFPVNFRCHMEKNGLTYNELSKLTGIGFVTISNYARGKAMPSLKNLVKLADAFGVSPASLLETGSIDESCLNIKKDKAEKFGRKLAETMHSRRINGKAMRGEDLAKAIGVSRQMVSNYTRGKSFPSKEVLKNIADCLDVTVEYLMGAEEE